MVIDDKCFINIYLFGCTRSYLQHVGSSSPTRDQTQALCIGALSLIHWTTREVLMTGCFRFLPYYDVNTQLFLWVISLSLFQGSWWDWQSQLSCLPRPRNEHLIQASSIRVLPHNRYLNKHGKSSLSTIFSDLGPT